MKDPAKEPVETEPDDAARAYEGAANTTRARIGHDFEGAKDKKEKDAELEVKPEKDAKLEVKPGFEQYRI